MPSQSTATLIKYLRKSRIDVWETLQIASVLELYRKGQLRMTPRELGDVLRDIAPGHTKTVLQCISRMSRTVVLGRRVREVADASPVEKERDRYTAAAALLAL